MTALKAGKNRDGVTICNLGGGAAKNNAGKEAVMKMARIVGAACMASSVALLTAPAMAAGIARVSFGQTAQTIEGFGGSDAWMPQMSTAESDALFANNNNNQMGLSILRVRIDPGGQFNWGTELYNAKAAIARGARIMATPWTPPASMKSNGSTIMGSLNTSSYAAFASYLQSYVTYMSNGGAPLYAISLQNEPDANVTYESCVWTAAQIDTWVAAYGGSLGTKLIIPESQNFLIALSDTTLNDSNAVSNVGIIAEHLYIGAYPSVKNVTPVYYANAFAHGKEVWETEHFISTNGITSAMYLAREISDSMAIGNYSAYLYWWVNDAAVDAYSDGLIDANNNIKPHGYMMAQWSKFVRPGYARAITTYSPTSNVYITAFVGGGHYVIVALNQGTAQVNQPFMLSGGTVTSLTPYQTSGANLSMTTLDTIPVSNNMFNYTLPAQSVTTFVQ